MVTLPFVASLTASPQGWTRSVSTAWPVGKKCATLSSKVSASAASVVSVSVASVVSVAPVSSDVVVVSSSPPQPITNAPVSNRAATNNKISGFRKYIVPPQFDLRHARLRILRMWFTTRPKPPFHLPLRILSSSSELPGPHPELPGYGKTRPQSRRLSHSQWPVRAPAAFLHRPPLPRRGPGDRLCQCGLHLSPASPSLWGSRSRETTGCTADRLCRCCLHTAPAPCPLPRSPPADLPQAWD